MARFLASIPIATQTPTFAVEGVGADSNRASNRFLPWANRARRSIAALGRSAADERGAEVVEGIGMFLLLLMMGLIIWQFMIIGHQMIVVADAARHGARSAAAHRNCLLAVEESVLQDRKSVV